MRGQEGDGQYPFVLYLQPRGFATANDETAHFRLLVRSQQLAKRSDRQEFRYKLIACFNDFIVNFR